MDTTALLAAILLAANLLSRLGARLSIPAVLCELLLGVVLGNLRLVGVPDEWFSRLLATGLVHRLAELGVILLLFLIGLETRLSEMRKVGVDATRAAVAGVVAPVALAFIMLRWIPSGNGDGFPRRLFLAAALSATSVGITARLLQGIGKLTTRSGRIILGAAVIDDVLGIIVLAIISAIAMQGAVSIGAIGALLGKIAIFGFALTLIRRYAFDRFLLRLKISNFRGIVPVFLICICLLAAWASEKAGMTAIIGAFAVGLLLEEAHFPGHRETRGRTLADTLRPLISILTPVFFIVMGMGVSLSSLWQTNSMALAGALIVSAVIGKLACGLAIRKGSGDRWLVGLGMVPRGEVGLIFASMGLQLAVLNRQDYSAVIAMVAVTTLLAPFLVTWRAKRAGD